MRYGTRTKIYVTGHTGLVGSAIVRKLTEAGYTRVITMPHRELDLALQADAERFFKNEQPQCVIACAAKVGGIEANMAYPAQFLYENLALQTNVLHAAYRYGVKKLLFFASACVYPRECPQPMKEEYLLSGRLEPTNEAYSVAKIAGIKMCQAYNRQYGTNFVSVIPTNAYGPDDNFNPQSSHVIPSLFMKFHKAMKSAAPSVTVWGSGNQRREFIYIDDIADACLFLMEHADTSDIINVGTGEDITIRELAAMIRDIVGYNGEIIFDTSKPDGMPRKLLDVSRLRVLGWHAKTRLREGIKKTYAWYLKKQDQVSANR